MCKFSYAWRIFIGLNKAKSIVRRNINCVTKNIINTDLNYYYRWCPKVAIQPMENEEEIGIGSSRYCPSKKEIQTADETSQVLEMQASEVHRNRPHLLQTVSQEERRVPLLLPNNRWCIWAMEKCLGRYWQEKVWWTVTWSLLLVYLADQVLSLLLLLFVFYFSCEFCGSSPFFLSILSIFFFFTLSIYLFYSLLFIYVSFCLFPHYISTLCMLCFLCS